MKSLHVHFMGIGGSGMSAVAQIADYYGYEISGCDQESDTPYLEKVKMNSPHLAVTTGHSAEHLHNVDILCVTPAVYFHNPDHPEFVEAKRNGIVMTWQEFMGKYLHKDKYVICIAGTHGKSTTTAMVGHVLEQAQLEPTVEVGATVPFWKRNVRICQSKYFVCEADEYYGNFLNYSSDVVVLNNIEMDHPEYFITFDKLLATFVEFVKRIKDEGSLIYNADNVGNLRLVALIKELQLNIRLIPYRLVDFPTNLRLGVPGNHNKLNALGVLKLAELLQIDHSKTHAALSSFSGIGRRVELLGEKNNIKVYDDYANHPTAFKASLNAVKELDSKSKVWAVVEPHTYSRLRAVVDLLPDSLKQADEVIVTKIFACREADPGDFHEEDIAAATKHPNVQVIKDFQQVVQLLKIQVKPSEVILVMGSGDSYKLTRQILENL